MASDRPRDEVNDPKSDPVIDLIVATLKSMPPSQRNRMLMLLDSWQSRSKEDFAILTLLGQPELTDSPNETDSYIATLCHVSRRTVYRWVKYQEVKERIISLRVGERREGYPLDGTEW